MGSIQELVQTIIQKHDDHLAEHIFTIAISGIDASGKGYIAKLLQDELEKRRLKVANINIDPWHNPIEVRLQKENAAENFYNHVFRWKELFNQLIIPLREKGSIQLATQLIKTDVDVHYNFKYNYDKIDILMLEGIFLFQEKFLSRYDYKIWIDCSFETGMKRAVARNIEQLGTEQLIADYNTYYYPAQHFHFKKDDPKTLADFIFDND